MESGLDSPEWWIHSGMGFCIPTPDPCLEMPDEGENMNIWKFWGDWGHMFYKLQSML